MKKIFSFKKFFRPVPIALYLILLMLFLIVIKEYKIVSVKITRDNDNSPKEVIKKNVEGISTHSAWLVGPKVTVTPSLIPKASNIPIGKSGEMTVSCVIYPNCGGGEKILPLSVCENSVCCYENGGYIQRWDKKSCGDNTSPGPQDVSEPVNNYYYPVYIEESTNNQSETNFAPLYMEVFSQTYYCLDYRHTEILLAQEDFFRERDEVFDICAKNDTFTYESCLNNCESENFDVCDDTCYSQIDWECSVNITDSPEYRTLEHLLSMYCK